MITIIPDIHGRVFWKKAVDSMDFKKSNPERVVLLLGNQDWVVFHRVCPLVFKTQIEDNILKKWIECFNASDMVTLFIILSGWLSA